MCLIAFAIQARPGLPLLLAGNRDEFFERPTAPLHRWAPKDGVDVLAGRDLRDGGTWLGVSAAGRIAMLTNVRSAELASGARSRGELATHWLRGDLDAPAMQDRIDPLAYAGFNLVLGDLHRGEWIWLSNCAPERPHAGPQPGLSRQILTPGVYGVSNASLDTPWPKTQRLKSALNAALQVTESPSAGLDSNPELQLLQSALADGSQVLPEQLPNTGVDPARERALSAAFVQMPESGYGTRSSLVLKVSSQGEGAARAQAWEWTHTPQTPGKAHRWDHQRLAHHTLDL